MAAWYEASFGEDYLIVYKHRDLQGASAEVRSMAEWLQLPPGSRVFDLCCGMGRHSMALADAGYDVTGMDLSRVLLEEARRNDQENRVTWLEGDMRCIPVEGPFDAVVDLFTSFGYFEDDNENARVLKEIERILKPGGKYIIDYLNAEYVRRHLVPHSERQEGDMHIDERRSVEDGFVRKRIVITEPGRPERTYLEQVKLYGLEDFRRMLADADLAVDHVYGYSDGSPYSESDSQRLILVGHKPADQSIS